MEKKIKTYRMSIYLKDGTTLVIDDLLAYGISNKGHNEWLEFHTLVNRFGGWNGMINHSYQLEFAYRVDICDEDGENNEVVWLEDKGKINE